MMPTEGSSGCCLLALEMGLTSDVKPTLATGNRTHSVYTCPQSVIILCTDITYNSRQLLITTLQACKPTPPPLH